MLPSTFVVTSSWWTPIRAPWSCLDTAIDVHIPAQRMSFVSLGGRPLSLFQVWGRDHGPGASLDGGFSRRSPASF